MLYLHLGSKQTWVTKIAVTKSKTLLSAILFSLLACQVSTSRASPWIEAGDTQTRHHLQYLKDTGILKLALTTWPLAWSDVNYELDDVLLDNLDEAQLWSYHYLKHELTRAKRRLKASKTLYASSSIIPYSHFGSEAREDIALKSKTSYLNNRFAFTFSAQLVENSDNGDLNLKYDGTYAALTFGNWIVGAGAVDRWWGPGWQSSLVLSNHARPAPGIFLKRKTSVQSQSKYMNWLGNWTLDAFANTLENDYQYIKPKLLGGRIGLAPLSGLEIGYSRIGLWGGRGRTETADTLGDFISRDDIETEVPGENTDSIETIPSNQLTAYDVRVGTSFKTMSLSLYGQYLNNESLDEADSESAAMVGIESAFNLGSLHNRLAIEFSDTTSSTIEGDNQLQSNPVYSHPYYIKGYSYQGRVLGESTGTDAKKSSLAGDHYFTNGHQLTWRLILVDLSESDSLDTINSANVDNQTLIQLNYKLPVNSFTMVNFGLFALDKKVTLNSQENNSGALIELSFRL